MLRSIVSEGGLVKNAALLTIADAAAKGATGVLALLIARYLGPALFGQYAIASAVGGLFIMLTGIGFEQEFTRRGGIDRDDIPFALSLNFTALAVSSAVASAGLVVFLAFSPYPGPVVFLTLLLWGALVFGRFHFLFRYLSLLWQRSGVAAVLQGGSTIVLLAATVLAIMDGQGLVVIVSIQLVVAALTLGAWLWWLPTGSLRFGELAVQNLWEFGKKALPYGLSNLIWIAYFNFDAFMLSLMRSESEVGLYAGVFRIVAICYIVGFAVSSTFTPDLFRSYQAHRAHYAILSRRLLATLATLSMLLAGVLLLFSDGLVALIIGPEYAEAGAIMRLLSIAALFRLMNFGLSDLLTTSGRQTLRVSLESILLAVNIIANLLLIPQYGANGAAMATLGAEMILFGGVLLSCLRAGLLSRQPGLPRGS